MPRKKGSATVSFTVDGIRHYVTGKNAKDAASKAALMKKDIEEGKIAVSGNMTVREWSTKCVEKYKTNQKEITRGRYVGRMNHCINEYIGSYPLCKIKPIHCQDVINHQQGNSKYQINQVYQMLNFIFRKAVENGLMLSNPAEHITRPQGTKTERRSATETERSFMIDVGFADRKYTLWMIMLYCGLRPSEAAKAKGMDIQKINGYNVLHVRGTKSSHADRYVPIDDKLYETIKKTPKYKFICPDIHGEKRSSTSRFKLWRSFKRDLNLAMGCEVDGDGILVAPYPLAPDLVPYCLRHTFCTDLQKKGVDIRTAQYLMGHSDITLTANIYTHADKTTITEAARLMS